MQKWKSTSYWCCRRRVGRQLLITVGRNTRKDLLLSFAVLRNRRHLLTISQNTRVSINCCCLCCAIHYLFLMLYASECCLLHTPVLTVTLRLSAICLRMHCCTDACLPHWVVMHFIVGYVMDSMSAVYSVTSLILAE